jgi:hypothetical protein
MKKSKTQLASHIMVYIWLHISGKHYAVLKPVRNYKYVVAHAIIPFSFYEKMHFHTDFLHHSGARTEYQYNG